MTIGCILILNSRGDILCSRNYRDFQNVRQVGETFRTQVISTKLADRCPVHNLGGTSFMFSRVENIWFVACTRQNANAGLVFQFISKVLQVFELYFGNVNEEIVRENHITILELLDEMLDYGYPQVTEAELLKHCVTNTGLKDVLTKVKKDAKSLSDRLTGIIGWRKEGLKYRKNEVFIDVIEEVNALIAQNGTVLQRDVSGKIMMKSFLSGMPECRFGLNDKLMLQAENHKTNRAHVDIDDLTFHQCVRLGKFESSRSISFIPPDGEFQLMKYRTSDNVTPAFRLLHPSFVTHGKTRIELGFMLKGEFSSRLNATGVVVKIPCPKNTASTKCVVGAGKAKYEPENQAIVWRIRKFPGDNEVVFSATIQLISSTSDTKPWARPPISMNFQVPMLTTSGLQVRFLKIHEPKLMYQAVKWVRYITTAGQYELRI